MGSLSKRGMNLNRWFTWLLLSLILAVLLLKIIIQAGTCPVLINLSSPIPVLAFGQVVTQLSGMAFGILGVLIARHHPENRLSWIFGLGGFSLVAFTLLIELTRCGWGSDRMTSAAAWTANLLITPMFVSLFVLPPLNFPDGKYISSIWKRFTQGSLLILGPLSLVASFLPGTLGQFLIVADITITNPLPLLSWEINTRTFGEVYLIILIGVILVSNLSLLARWHQAKPVVQHQLKWLAYFLVFVAIVHVVIVEGLGNLFFPQVFDSWFYLIMLFISFTAYPLIIGIAILKYRLYDIDLIIRRTLVYSALTFSLGLVYFGSVIILQQFIRVITGQAATSQFAIVISTLAIAALFTPLHRRLQDVIDRRFYRRRIDSEKATESFNVVLREEVNLDQLCRHLVAIVEETMQPEMISLQLKEPGER